MGAFLDILERKHSSCLEAAGGGEGEQIFFEMRTLLFPIHFYIDGVF